MNSSSIHVEGLSMNVVGQQLLGTAYMCVFASMQDGPACIAFHCSHLYITKHVSVSHFAKTLVSLQTSTYKGKNTKYFGINLLLT